MTMHAPLMIDVAGLKLTKVDKRRLSHPLVGGVILFARNWESRAQLSRLCAQIKKVRADLLITVDHEGGRVQRFRTDGFTHLPTMRTLGAMWMNDPKGDGSGALHAMDVATAAGYVLAAELRACGVDMSYAPVLDLDYGTSAVIGDRSFGADPRVVAVLARSVMHGLAQAGMRNCGKHFPGHGFVAADSHVDVPVDERPLDAILGQDAAPYAHLRSAMDAVMPAHVIYPQVDDRPAGFSRRWLQDILRADMGFGGLIFSDDLSMAGARQLEGRTLSYAQAAEMALRAGCDMVLLCNQCVVDDGAPIDELIDGLSQALLSDRWRPTQASEQRRLALLPDGPALAWDDLVLQARYQQALEMLP
jgi:beta-N-acetylhexosaminidase